MEAVVQSQRLLVDEPPFLQFEVEELLQGTGTAAVLAVGRVVLTTVGDDPLQVSHKELPGHVVAATEPLCHGLQVWGSEKGGEAFRRRRRVAVHLGGSQGAV